VTRCDDCGKHIPGIPYECNHCGGNYCPDCRLPEKHSCSGLYAEPTPEPRTVQTVDRDDGILTYLLGFVYLLFVVVRYPFKLAYRIIAFPFKRPYTVAYNGLVVGVVAAISILAIGLYGGIGVAPVDRVADRAAGGVGETTDILSEATEGPTERQLETAIHQEVNAVRSENALSRLEQNSELQEASRGHSDHMAAEDYFAHESPSGESPQDRVDEVGIACLVAENLYYEEGYSTADREEVADRVVQGWLDSPGHRANLLDPQWRVEGIGVEVAGDELYVTQMFCK